MDSEREFDSIKKRYWERCRDFEIAEQKMNADIWWRIPIIGFYKRWSLLKELSNIHRDCTELYNEMYKIDIE